MQITFESRFFAFCLRTSQTYVPQQDEKVLPPALNMQIGKYLWSTKKGWRSMKTEFQNDAKQNSENSSA